MRGKLLTTGVTCAVIIWGLLSCGDKLDPVSGRLNCPDPITYAGQVQAILQNHCLACHSIGKQGAERNGAPVDVNFDTYAGIHVHLDHAGELVQTRTMPPSGYGVPALTDDEIQQFQCWIQQGGNP